MKKSDNSERGTHIKDELVNIDKFNCPECLKTMIPLNLDKHICGSCGAKIEQITIFRKGLTKC